MADEPTGNLDEHTSDQIIDLLFGMHERLGTTLLLVTHQKSLAERCGRMLTIRDGLVADDQTALRMAGD